jgi:hypothetical protein
VAVAVADTKELRLRQEVQVAGVLQIVDPLVQALLDKVMLVAARLLKILARVAVEVVVLELLDLLPQHFMRLMAMGARV